jgi:serine protease Do
MVEMHDSAMNNVDLRSQQNPRTGRSRLGVMMGPVAAVGLALLAVPAFGQTENLLPDLIERLQPSVVNIDTTTVLQGRRDLPELPDDSPLEEFFKQFGDDGPRNSNSGGSGFIIDSSGIIVTNNHVIENADEIEVVLFDESRVPATVIGVDLRTDLAVLRIETDIPLSAVPWGNSRSARVGERVVAIGNPFGLGGSVTTGIISALQRNINNEALQSFIQTDAAINPGNSGGPLFDMDGQVIGVNTAIFSRGGGSIGLGFSIPSEIAERVVSQIQDFGKVRRGWLGVRIQDVDDEKAADLGLDRPRGALIASVESDSPAEDGEIAAGDVILQFNGQEIDARPDLQRVVAGTDIGRPVAVDVWRNGEVVTLQVTVGEFPEAGIRPVATTTEGVPEFEGGGVSALGLELSPLDEEIREQFGIGGGVDGLIITNVTPGGPAASKGLRPGDVILEVNQSPVATAADVQDAIDRSKSSGRGTVLMMVQQPDGERRFIVVPIAKG